ncbi:hypothetical protein CHS0354_030769 [Potamilus streckersoni]|uniref:Uncharacterized protein n=1 Tax=Potamilus streckersoni TaxID=2493646 RepID=A0AAE0TDF5_9BIVA|nr:hypothetical protein CHS0354_030769 [Potamilus streckersoni]
MANFDGIVSLARPENGCDHKTMNTLSIVIVLLGCLTTNKARLLNSIGAKEIELRGTGQMKDNSITSSFNSRSNHPSSFSTEKKGVEFNADMLQSLLYKENGPTVVLSIFPLDMTEVKSKGGDRVEYHRNMFGLSRANFFGILPTYSSRQERETTPLVRVEREIDFTDPVIQELLRFYMKHQKGKGRYGSRWG